MIKYFFVLLCACCVSPMYVTAQLDTKPLIEGVGVDEHLGDVIDLETSFVDAKGNTLKLGALFQDTRPVILAPVYYNCPSMCTLTLDRIRDFIDESALRIGSEYAIVNISINPDNSPELAAQKADTYLATLQQKNPDVVRDHWWFLSGNQAAITKIMDQVGFRYKKIGEEYSHASVIVVLSPEGKISRYFNGLSYPEPDVRFALVEASEGKIGTASDRIYSFCFKYDPLRGKHTVDAVNILRAGGILTMLFMVVGGLIIWKKGSSKKRRVEQNA